MQSYALSKAERLHVERLVDTVAGGIDSVEDEAFVARRARLASAELPVGLRAAVLDFRTHESGAGLRISGWDIESDLPATPTRPRPVESAKGTLRHDVYFYLVAELVGDPVGWATQQQGRIMHDIYPLESMQSDQIGWSSDTVLTWHTEDAFHPYRADYLGLCCLRNPTNVGTTYADVRNVTLSAKSTERLRQPSFVFIADAAHTVNGSAGIQHGSILFGDPKDPYLRLDPEYMQDAEDSRDRAAVDEITDAINIALERAILEPGDLFFIDNFRAVHGRERFQARFDGTDRWLRRMNITRDLRKSRDARASAGSRVIL
jgi:Fe(II)/alpha-ketoglutarate-dependent arginine beta-hydroxylase